MGVRLTGQLVCPSPEEAALVEEHLLRHTELTRAETGCLSFEVVPTHDPLIWRVTEHFTDRAAFDAHQTRASGSEWGLVTSGIKRDYMLSESDVDTWLCPTKRFAGVEMRWSSA